MTPQTTKEDKRPTLYTRAMVAATIKVDTPLLRKWAKDPNAELFGLPENGHRPYHRRQVVGELNRMHNRCRWLAPLVDVPEALHTGKEVRAHFGVSKRTLRNWARAGAPRFIFSERTIRYLIPELEQWYAMIYCRPRVKDFTGQA